MVHHSACQEAKAKVIKYSGIEEFEFFESRTDLMEDFSRVERQINTDESPLTADW